MNFVTRFRDNNVAHILRSEIMPLSLVDPTVLAGSEIYILKEHVDPSNAAQKWRKYLLSKMFSKVHYAEPHEIFGIKKPFFVNTSDGYNFHDFIDIEPSAEFIRLSEFIKANSAIRPPEQEYVLLNQRPVGNRYLIEAGSETPLEDYLREKLSERGIAFKNCDFSQISPQEQAQICGGAAVFLSAHGAGCSNIIFTPLHCAVIEYNFRKYWHCDPVCDRHFDGTLADKEACDSGMDTHPIFHKADFRNLSLALGRSYTELEVVRYEGRSSRNPISRDYMFVDGDALLLEIEKSLKQAQSKKGITFQYAEKPGEPTYVGEPMSDFRSRIIAQKLKARYFTKYLKSKLPAKSSA
ncbi:MAG: glycosyltransferase family 61 protein [Pseudomonadota bacterium]